MEDIGPFIYRFAMAVPGILLAVICHEYGHGRMALQFGDSTALKAGRLTLNPIPHLDIIGSFIVPMVGVLLGGVAFGWAKPVPINPRNFPQKQYKKAVFWVSFAGPMANFILVIIFAFAAALVDTQMPTDFSLTAPLRLIFEQAMVINAVLGTFNLIPLPPLDGSKMLAMYVGPKGQQVFDFISQYSFFILLILIFTRTLNYILTPPIYLSYYLMNIFVHFLGMYV